MAYKVEKISSPKMPPHNLAVKDYVCDSEDDISKLPKFGVEGTQVLNDGDDKVTNEPCNYGSSATVISPFSGYKLAPSNNWVKIF